MQRRVIATIAFSSLHFRGLSLLGYAKCRQRCMGLSSVKQSKTKSKEINFCRIGPARRKAPFVGCNELTVHLAPDVSSGSHCRGIENSMNVPRGLHMGHLNINLYCQCRCPPECNPTCLCSHVLSLSLQHLHPDWAYRRIRPYALQHPGCRQSRKPTTSSNNTAALASPNPCPSDGSHRNLHAAGGSAPSHFPRI